MLKKLFGWIVNRWTVSVFGLVIVAVLIWVFGPALAFGGYVPLASALARMIVILAVVLAWFGYQVAKALKQRQANKTMLDGLTQAPVAEDPKEVASREEREGLAERFQEALATLKSAPLGARGSRRQLYQLPWYLLIGPPGSGKTTALANSGLRFPLAETFGKNAVRGVGGTRNCDWFFTDEAVLIDTAGRYTTQDSDEAVDRSAWQAFLDLLRKYRRRRPIDGLIVAFSIADLAKRDSGERLAHARAVKRRVQEVYKLLQIRTPVYVIFTKCDLIAGFKEFFASLRAEEREQVWGITFDLEEAGRIDQVLASFPHEFDRLIDRLTTRQLPRIEEERDIGERGLMLSFPQQMALLKPGIDEFIAEAFGPTRYEEPCLLRGIYFTSATQEGSPIDRVIGVVAASFGLERQAMPAFSGRGRSYFLTRLLRDVIFKESALVSSTSWLERYRPWLLKGAYAGTGILTLGVISLLFVSYAGNRTLVADVDQTVDQLKATSTSSLAGQGSLEETIATLTLLRNLPDGYAERDQRAPLRLTFGLYQGEKLGTAAEGSYRRALNLLLLPRLMTRMEEQIAANLDRPDFLYQALKFYLMVTTPERRDPELLRVWISRHFETHYPGAANAELRGALNDHVQALFERELDPPPASNKALVATARQVLLQLPVASRVYTQLRTEQGAERADGWTLAKAVPPNHLRFFVRRSNAPMTEGIPHLYTVEGYQDVFVRRRSALVGEVVEDTWVLGPDYARLQAENERADLERKVEEFYFADYIRVWKDLIRDIDVVPFHNVEQQADMVRLFAQTNSPIKSVLEPIAAQTALARALTLTEQKTINPGELQRLRDRIERWMGSTGSGEVQAAGIDPAARVDREFAPIHALLQSDDSAPPPIDSVLSALNDLYEYLLQVQQTSTQGQGALDHFSELVTRGRAVVTRMESLANAQPEPLSHWLRSLTTTSSALTIDKARAGAQGRVKEVWATGIAPQCRTALAGRYPFVKTAMEDANLIDFARLFGPGGLIETFSQQHVLPFADTSVQPWRWRTGDEGAIALSSGSLRMFERAARIREAFFATGSASPGVFFEIEPLTLDSKARQVVLEIGDQRIVYQHGPRRPERVQWPPARGAGALVAFTPAEEIGQTITLAKSGPWALFHLLDEARIQRAGGVDRFRISFDVRGYRADFLIRAESVINPFVLPELEQFRCLGQL